MAVTMRLLRLLRVGICCVVAFIISVIIMMWNEHRGFLVKNGNDDILTGHILTPSAEGKLHSKLAVRSSHMKKQCHELQNQLHEDKVKLSQFNHIIYDDHYKTLYCKIPKVASANWMRMFLILGGFINTTNFTALSKIDVHDKINADHFHYLSDLDSQEIQYRLENYFKFIIVREPFERLLSAYRNKFAAKNNSTAYFRRRFGRRIIEKYRLKSNSTDSVTFSEFVQYILDKNRGENLNEHWAEYHSLCLPCIVKYDYIGKYESLARDSVAIVNRMGASGVIKFPPRSSSYRHGKTSSVLYDFYKQLSTNSMLKLLKHYYPDFLLFNYSLPKSLHNLTHSNVLV